jgi:malate synthase
MVLHDHINEVVDSNIFVPDEDFAALVRELFDAEMAAVRTEMAPARFEGGRFKEAIELIEALVFSPSFEEFLTVPAYAMLRD